MELGISVFINGNVDEPRIEQGVSEAET